MIMIICIHKKDTLQIMAENKQQSLNLRLSVECNKHFIWLIIDYEEQVCMRNISYVIYLCAYACLFV